MELIKLIICCCFAVILLADVMIAKPVSSREILAEVEQIEAAVEEGLGIYRAERHRRRRHRRRTNWLVEAMRMCLNYRHYPRNRIPAHCRDILYRQTASRQESGGPTIVIIEK